MSSTTLAQCQTPECAEDEQRETEAGPSVETRVPAQRSQRPNQADDLKPKGEQLESRRSFAALEREEVKMTYLNRDQQEQIILMTVGMGVMEILAEQDKFRSARADLLRARSFGKRALDNLREVVEPDSFTRVRSLADSTKLVIRPKTSPEESEINIKMSRLHDLHAAAIGNHCRGCDKKDFKKCPTRELLMDTHCPPAQETKTDCQYRQ